jgi:hypothetical protein
MTQETGTEILARARILCQDNDSASNFSVSAANALILLNDILISLSNNARVKPKWIGASVSGLTFAAGASSKVTTSDINATEIESFHQSNSSTAAAPFSPAIERVSVQEMLALHDYDGDNVLTSGGTEWLKVAAEKSQDLTAAGVEVWRVWVYPVINRTRYIHLRVPSPVTIGNIGDKPDLDTVDSRVVSRLLAYEMARLNKENSADFLNGILAPVPKEVVSLVYGGAVRGSQLQDHVICRRDC